MIVTFDTARDRDEVRSKVSNLRSGDNAIGCQLGPSDFLRGQYQAFQNLAFCLKKKNPDLKRNIKFCNRTQTMIMDVNLDGAWKTVEYAAAKSILKVKSQTSKPLTGRELKSCLNSSDVIKKGLMKVWIRAIIL